ncbi:MAG TPA: hypothetical protein VGO59_02345 [Verrucomicrobiae bacterium]|jgi:hypothetical protein
MRPIEQIANAVLYEGFLLYPYRLSSVKNQHRWNFGVLCPEPFAGAHAEKSSCQAECLFDAKEGASVDVMVRFLQLVDGNPVEREILANDVSLDAQAGQPREFPVSFSGLAGKLELSVPRPNVFRARITNGGCFNGKDRGHALDHSLIATHAILSLRGGKFISLIDPPSEWQPAAAQCQNIGLWPVLAGADDTEVLAAPIILYDHPQIAPQSRGDLFDATEIDEILTLRIQTLTDDEKDEARAGDARIRSMFERSETLTREQMLSLHASMRPDPGRLFQKGDRVRLQPRRRADIFDIALAGKLATVLSIERDFDNAVHVCVTVDDDPGKDLGEEGKPGHRFFFRADEVEPA